MVNEKIFKMPFASVYTAYINKAARKGRNAKEVDQIICWLTGYSKIELLEHIDVRTDFEGFFAQAKLHPNAHQITGVICGYRIEEIENPLMKKLDT